MLHLRIFQYVVHSIVISYLWGFIDFQDTNSCLWFFPLSSPLSAINLANIAESTSEASLNFQDFLINTGKAFFLQRWNIFNLKHLKKHLGSPGLRSLTLKPTISHCSLLDSVCWLHCIVRCLVSYIGFKLSVDTGLSSPYVFTQHLMPWSFSWEKLLDTMVI